MKSECFTCKNKLVNIYLAESGGNKKTIGKFCVHCDTPREPNEYFLELQNEKILKTQEKKSHIKFDNKVRCPYCNNTKYKKLKDKFVYHKTPVYEKDGKTIKKFTEKKINKIKRFKCKNPKCRAETHKGKWSVNESLI